MAEITTQIVREAEPIENLKLALMEAAQKSAMPTLPAYQVAGMTKDQVDAVALGQQGIGAYAPYLQAGSGAVSAGTNTLAEAADVLRGADTRGQFTAAQQAFNQAAVPAAALGNLSNVAGAGMGFLSNAGADFDNAQRLALEASRANIAPSQAMMLQSADAAARSGPRFAPAQRYLQTGAQLAQQAAQQPGFQQGINTLSLGALQGQGAVDQASQQSQMGIGALFQAAQQAQQAAALGAAPQAQAATTAFSPNLQQFQMGPAERVGAQQISAPTADAAQMGPAERISTQSFAQPGSADAYMSPYMQNVVAAQQREARRASDIQGTYDSAAVARSGAFGGGRHAIIEAERRRNLATQLGDIQATGLQQAYQQAQGQFNVEQQARLAAQQANQQAGLAVGQQNLGAQQQTNLANQAAQLQAQGMNAQQAMQAALANQQAGLAVGQQNLGAQLQTQQLGTQTGLQTSLANLGNQQQANLANQQMQGQYGLQGAQFGMQAADALRQAGIGTLGSAQQMGALGLQGAGLTQNVGQSQLGAAGQQGQLGLSAAGQVGQTGSQLGALEGQRAQQAFQAAQYAGNIGQQLGTQQMQQAQLGQSAAGLYGQLAGQQAGLAGQYAGVAGQQANILAQQAQLQQALGQGIGNLAAQQFGVGQNMAQGLGALGTQAGNLGMQQAALGQQAQGLGQQDVNFLYNLGAQQQRQSQAELDALRATNMQTAMQPMQQMAFVSDIYRGAPSTQMSITQQQTPTPSPFQQIAGLGIAGIGAAAAGARAGIL